MHDVHRCHLSGGAGRLSAKNFLIRDHSVKLCRHDGVPRTPRVRFRVGLVAPVTHATFGSSEHEHTSFRGTGSGASHMMGSAETSRRLACDATRVVMRHDADGHVTEVGARTRTIPPALRRVLQHRDRGCRFPGCGLPFGQGHHIRHWAHGGPTTLSNLAMLCRRHHRCVHEEGYQIERQPDGVLRFRRPDGLLLPDVPPPAAVPTNPIETLRAQNDRRGVDIDARTSMPGWLGGRLDVGWAIDVLHPLATGEIDRTSEAVV